MELHGKEEVKKWEAFCLPLRSLRLRGENAFKLLRTLRSRTLLAFDFSALLFCLGGFL